MSRKKVIIEENYHCNLDGRLLIEIVKELQSIVDDNSELEDIRMDVDINYEWDSAYIKAEIYGYREKTKEELAEEQQAEEDRIKSRIENIEKMKREAEEELQKLKGEIK